MDKRNLCCWEIIHKLIFDQDINKALNGAEKF